MPIRTLRPTVAAAALVLIAACGPQPREAPTDSDQVRERALQAQTARRSTGAEIQDRALNRVISAVYLCGNAERLSVDFDNPRQMATVRTSRGEAFDLYQERAASGIWYRATGYELRGKGKEATWTAAGRAPIECRAID